MLGWGSKELWGNASVAQRWDALGTNEKMAAGRLGFTQEEWDTGEPDDVLIGVPMGRALARAKARVGRAKTAPEIVDGLARVRSEDLRGLRESPGIQTSRHGGTPTAQHIEQYPRARPKTKRESFYLFLLRIAEQSLERR